MQTICPKPRIAGRMLQKGLKTQIRVLRRLYAFAFMPWREYKEIEDEELEEAKELFKEGLKRIFQATKKVSEKVVEGFREGYAQDVTKKEE